MALCRTEVNALMWQLGDILMDELLTFKQTAELLAVSEKTLFKLLAEEEVPARKIGSKWVFSRQAIIDWISKGNSKHYARNATLDDD